MQCELDGEARDQLAMLAYAKWAYCFDNLKAAKSEKDDGSQDWAEFHAERVKNAIADEAKASRVLDQIKKYSPLIIGS